MLNISISLLAKTSTLAAVALTLAACSPQYNWREIQSESAPFAIAMPAKPTTFARQIDLNGVSVLMTMTAVEVGHNTFAVGTAELPDAIQAQRSVSAMKTAMINNIHGSIRHEKVLTMPDSAHKEVGTVAMTEIEAISADKNAIDGQPRVLYARFAANDKRVYQLVATGSERIMTRDLATLFFASFKFN